MKKINFDIIKKKIADTLVFLKNKLNYLLELIKGKGQNKGTNIYSGASNKNKLNALKDIIFSNKVAVGFVLLVVVLAFVMCSKKDEKPEVPAVSAVDEIAENIVTPVEAEEIKEPVTDKSFEVMKESRDILFKCYEVLEQYYNDMKSGYDPSVKKTLEEAKALIDDIDGIEKDKISEGDCLEMINKTDLMLEKFTGLFSMNMPQADEIDTVIDTISGTMWLDDELNAYGFEHDGHTLYMVNADGSEQYEGSYEMKATEKGYIQITTDIADKKTVGLISQCTSAIFEYTDLDTGITTLLMPVSYEKQ